MDYASPVVALVCGAGCCLSMVKSAANPSIPYAAHAAYTAIPTTKDAGQGDITSAARDMIFRRADIITCFR
jgi:hypothetical protein